MNDTDLSLALSPDVSDSSGQADSKPQGDEKAPDTGAGNGVNDGADKSKDTTQGDGTAKPETQASEQGKEELKGVLPKELEPHKDLIDSRKFDLTKPDGVAKLAQSYKEVESFAQKSQTQSKNSQDKATRVAAIASGSAEDLNKWRKSQGLPELSIDTRSHEDKSKETDDLYGAIDKALAGDENSVKWLNNHFAKQRENLLIAKVRGESQTGNSADQVFQDRKSAASITYSNAFKANPEAKTFVDELSDHFNQGGVFDSLGIDVLDAFATPERAEAFLELGKAMNVYKNLDKVVNGRVDAEIERRRAAGNTGGAGKQGAKGSRSSSESEKEFDATQIFR